MRFRTLFLLIMASCIGFVLFKLKYKVMSLENEYKHVIHDINATQDSINILHAEWAHLNSPARLQALAQKYLKEYQPIRHDQLFKQWPRQLTLATIGKEPSGKDVKDVKEIPVKDTTKTALKDTKETSKKKLPKRQLKDLDDLLKGLQ